MKNLFENKKIIIGCLLLITLVFVIVYLIPRINNSNNTYKEDNYSFLKDYSVNQYIPVTINEEAMAKIYITEFKNLMINEPERAYSYINNDYKTKKFGSYDNFLQYINDIQSVVFFDYEISQYDIVSSGGNNIFYVKDKTDNLYIFKEKSIMQYEVYLDNNTVQIK